ncbi:unnamed protein product [Meloidogyne enterolobii]|uniref:Uncharacterized protein n=1 Tax=Meloidogyne enterolobii TaxID=390850 RepID=A0ACB0ZT93_MELEN
MGLKFLKVMNSIIPVIKKGGTTTGMGQLLEVNWEYFRFLKGFSAISVRIVGIYFFYFISAHYLDFKLTFQINNYFKDEFSKGLALCSSGKCQSNNSLNISYKCECPDTHLLYTKESAKNIVKIIYLKYNGAHYKTHP